MNLGGNELDWHLDSQAEDGGHFEYSYSVIGNEIPSGSTEAATLHITMRDEWGNTGEASAGSITVDFESPRLVGAVDLSSELVGRNGSLSIAFSVSEPLMSPPDVFLGDDIAVPLSSDPEGPEFIYSYEVDHSEAQAIEYPVRIELVDEVGNKQYSSARQRVSFDFTNPSVLPDSPTVWYVPDESSPLASVSAATTGCKVRVEFITTEILGASPVVSTTAPEFLEFTQLNADKTSFVFEFRLEDREYEQGQYDLSVVLRDAAGNDNTIDLPDFTVDTVNPDALAEQDRVLYRRAPWGLVETANIPQYSVHGVPDTFKAGGTVVIFEGPETKTANEAGRGVVAENGSFDIILNRTDRAEIYLAYVDSAGNMSDDDADSPGIQATELKQVEWIVTVGNKKPRSTFENPTIVLTSSRFLPILSHESADAAEPDIEDLEALYSMDSSALVLHSRSYWAERTPAASLPGPRSEQAVAFDTVRGSLYVLGGKGNQMQALDDTWMWSAVDRRWARLQAGDFAPAARLGSALAFDPSRGKLMLFGGSNAVKFDDLWELDTEDAVWSEITPRGTWPAARSDHAMVYDSRNRELMLFGGKASDGYLDDVWLYDVENEEWRVVTRSGDWPSARDKHAMVYDTDRGVVVLFGGYDGSQRLADTWEWNCELRSWIDRTGEGTSPDPRHSQAMAYDRRQKKTLLFSGMVYGSKPSDTWEWDGATGRWTELSPAGGSPPGRGAHSLAFDSSTGRIILFGGDFAGEKHGDLWEFDGERGSWTDITASVDNPPARSTASMVYDSARMKIVLFGGTAEETRFNDVWEWNGLSGNWSERTEEGERPLERSAHAMVYDEARHKVVIHAGYQTQMSFWDTWEWDPATGFWERQYPLGSDPGRRVSHGHTYDSGRGKVVIYAGCFKGYCYPPLGDLWEWDGHSDEWIEIGFHGEVPERRNAPELTYDSLRGRVIMFGGCSRTEFTHKCEESYNDLWEWDGSTATWAELEPAGELPPSRIGHKTIFDSTRGAVVLFAGNGNDEEMMDDIWSWSSAADEWVEHDPGGSRPKARTEHAMAFDASRGKIVVFGGTFATQSFLGDTWEWDAGTAEKPAILWKIPLEAAGIPSEAALARLSVSAVAGGTGYSTDAEANELHGADLLVWSAEGGGAWLPLASGATSSAEPSVIFDEISDRAGIVHLLYGQLRTMTFAITPSHPSGSGPQPGSVSADHLELTLSYRRP